MKTDTNRRVALITGGNRGIGLQTAKDLGPDGVILLLGVRDLAKGEAAAERIEPPVTTHSFGSNYQADTASLTTNYYL